MSNTQVENKVIIQEYIDQMDDKEKVAYKIAIEYLGSSFNLEKSIGFQKWLKKKAK
jgi:hypothetical protein|tara:strand:+ start:1262 stop:1429 length:168 start_codon:yes stop_codon:yes gene_type:complete